MRKYTDQHKKRISLKQPAIRSKIVSGMVITFDYPKSKNNQNPIVLVLDPDEGGLLHGLVLDYMTARQADSFGKYILKEIKEVDPDSNSTIQHSLYKLLEDNPKTFYNSRLKPYLNRKFKQSVYRTYNLTDLRNLKIVRYKFS